MGVWVEPVRSTSNMPQPSASHREPRNVSRKSRLPLIKQLGTEVEEAFGVDVGSNVGAATVRLASSEAPPCRLTVYHSVR